ncbi:heme ABC transporter ATP-binding protein [Photobacterium atrarenae]|uniref:Heme ABC transporter ATP-binding protein n=1 Tax=Photobacterium atrarenae TaxID=865757 RepID=A0ABY5GID2_9GAMM|nr:heme ABC transporter ATP-binding protein [Photobacterium atrarenae]UTV28890.1 heme ABC transporter ATP-binding protein [Photobacterium atrarenae]
MTPPQNPVSAPEHPTPAIEARALNLTLGGKKLLDDFSLNIASGELTALLGPNGAGKSSLLKVLCGEAEGGGTIRFFGKERKDYPPATLAKHLGILPQHSNLAFAFTAREVVELGSLPLQLTRKDTQALATEKMTQVDVLELQDRLYPSLSGGEKQRVHLARVLTQLSHAGDQCILMLDEPTSALDLSHQHQTLQVARTLANAGAAVIVVIHDLNLAAQYADRLVIVNHGKVQADGPPWQALTPDTIQRVYGWPVHVSKHPTQDFPVVLPAA